MIGWIGNLLLSFCGIPELLRTIKTSTCHIGWGMILMWLIGEVLAFLYIFNSTSDKALLVNYIINIAIIVVMLFYKIIPLIRK